MNHDRTLLHSIRFAATVAAVAVVAGCASTTVETRGTTLQAPLCVPGGPPVTTQVVWGTAWRPDQKEPALREAAALRGIQAFLDRSGCVATPDLIRIPDGLAVPSDEELIRVAVRHTPAPQRVLLVVIRELGPRLQIGIPVGVAGETEVLVDLRVLDVTAGRPLAAMRTHWRNGGSFVIKGVRTLDEDMAAALAHALLPGRRAE